MINEINFIIVIFLILYFFYLKPKDLYKFISQRKQKAKMIDLNYIHNLKKVVYTINLGNYDEIRGINKQSGYDYFLFVDKFDEIYNGSNWTIILLPESIKNLNISLIKKQRFIKTHPHLFFPNHDLSIYMDATYEINGNLDEFLLRFLTSKYSMYMLEHPERNKIKEEFNLVGILKKDNKSNIMKVKDRYNRTNFTDNCGLIESCLMIRKHNDKICIDTMEEWFNEIKNYSHRDQLSFNYVLWKTGRSIKYLSKNFCFQYLFGEYFHKKNVTFE